MDQPQVVDNSGIISLIKQMECRIASLEASVLELQYTVSQMEDYLERLSSEAEDH